MNSIKYRFSPPLWASALTLLGVLLFVKLSVWQWHRYQEKKVLQESYLAAMQAPPVHFPHPMPPTPPGRAAAPLYEHVSLQGHFDPHQFLLDNRTQKGEVGFDVITPLVLRTGGTLLIDRGFVPANASREIFTDITPPTGNLSIQGFLTEPSKNFVIGNIIEPETSNTWPKKIMSVAPEALAKASDTHFLPYLVLLSPQSPNGFSRIWSPPNFWAERSLGYCFQWLLFALLAIVLYLVMNLKKN